MAITHGVCNSFKLERYTGTHDFSADTFKIALYTSDATISPSTTAYTTAGEATGANYTAGGQTLSVASGFPKLNPSADGGVPASTMVLVDFDDVTWSNVTATARGALIYNSSKSNKAVMAIDFGRDVALTTSDLTIQWPVGDVNNAIIRSL